jgi:hypothetical protein
MTQLLSLGQTIAERDKSENDKEANGDRDEQNGLLDDLEGWEFPESPSPPARSENGEETTLVDYESEESENETGSVRDREQWNGVRKGLRREGRERFRRR